jgi:oxygen-independent coproporphyrinogen-3 oxidase
MIVVLFNKPEFEYDVHSLVKAFYPKEEIRMYYTCPEEDVKDKNLACTHHEAGAELDGLLAEAGQVLSVSYMQSRQCIGITNANALEMPESADRIEIGLHKKTPEMCLTKQAPTDFSDRAAAKNQLKQTLYRLLSESTGRTLPWGTLTGIRPTKIPMKLLEEGRQEEEIASYMRDTYLATDEKIALSIEIAKRERRLLEHIDYENGYSLYIGIPFCPSTCLYCSFTSYPLAAWRHQMDSYLDALEKEIDFTAQRFSHNRLNSVYIGGGTPTTLEPHQLDRLIHKIKCSFDLSDCREFTVEAGRPDSITREKLAVLRKNGISRISVNPQTMKQETLDLIGRHHTVEQTIESFRLARELGFDNINMDLIIGLPDEDIEDVRHTMEEIGKLRPDSLTVHSLAIKRAARLTIFKDRYQDMQMVNTQAHMDLCERYSRQMGLAPYYLYRQKGMAGNMENVGYAAEGKAGIYNILIMEEKQTIVACGAGATTKRVFPELNPDGSHYIERCENVKDVAQYMGRIDEMIERKQRLFSR